MVVEKHKLNLVLKNGMSHFGYFFDSKLKTPLYLDHGRMKLKYIDRNDETNLIDVDDKNIWGFFVQCEIEQKNNPNPDAVYFCYFDEETNDGIGLKWAIDVETDKNQKIYEIDLVNDELVYKCLEIKSGEMNIPIHFNHDGKTLYYNSIDENKIVQVTKENVKKIINECKHGQSFSKDNPATCYFIYIDGEGKEEGLPWKNIF